MPTPLIHSLVYLISLWILAGVVLALHYISPRIGLTPLVLFLGALLSVMLLLPWQGFTLNAASLPGIWQFNFNIYVILPTLLLGVLLVYIVNGTVHARSLMIGLVGLGLFLTGYEQIRDFFDFSMVMDTHVGETIGRTHAQTMLAASLAIAAGFLVLMLVYQKVSNLRNRHPSRTAGTVALLASLWISALVFPVIAYAGTSAGMGNIPVYLVGETLAGLALWVLLAPYLHKVAPRIPGSAATTPRPVLSIFTTALQAEERARYHHNLLRTIIQINQLVNRTTDAKTLLQQSCDALVALRDYRTVWMMPVDEGKSSPSFIACAGEPGKEMRKNSGKDAMFEFHRAGMLGEPIIINNLHNENSRGALWQDTMLKTGCTSAGLFPMRNQGRVLGLMGVCTQRPNEFNDLERDLLQELADDLAYALVNLETRSQQELLQKSTEAMRDGLLILDTKGKIIYANQIVAHFSGLPPSKLLKQDIRRLLTPQQQEKISPIYEDLLQHGASTFDLAYKTSDGNAVILAVTATLGRDAYDEPKYIVINVRDITSQRRYEQQLLALHQVAAELVQIHDPGQLAQTFLQTGESLLGADASALYLVDAQMNVIQAPSHNLPEAYVKFIAAGNLDGMPGETVRHTWSPVYVTDTLHDPTYKNVHIIAEHGFRSLIILPVTYQERIFGALTLYYHQSRQFSEDDVQVGMTLVHTLAIAYQNAELYQGESQQRELAEALARAAAAVNKSLHLEDVLDQILRQLQRVVPCTATNIVLVESGRVILTHQRGYKHFVLTQDFFDDVDELMRWDTYRTMYTQKEVVFIPDTWNDDRWVIHEETKSIRSYIGVPLIVGDQVVGFLNIDSDQPGSLKAEYLPQLQTFAEYAAVAIENARLYARATQRAEENAALLTAASAATKSLDLSEVLRVIAGQMVKTFHVDRCSILGYERETQEFQVLLRYFSDDTTEIPEQAICCRADQYPSLQYILERREPRIFSVSSPDIAAPARDALLERNIGAIALLPLVLQERVLGLIALVTHDATRTFSVREITLGLSMASHAATSIENARLYRQLQEHALDLEARVQRRTRQLQEITEYLEGILASVPEAVFVLNEDHALVHANQAGEALQKQAREIGLDLLAPDLIQTLERDAPLTMQSLLEVQDKAYQMVSSSLEGKDGRPGGKIIVFRDVTHFRELDRMKTQFVSDVSHELRTPLTNLTLYIDLLASTGDPARRDAYIQTLKRETGRLTHLIEDLLTISRLEAGRIQFQIRPVDINPLVESLVSDRVFLAAQRKIHLEFIPAPGLPPAAVDENMLTQALSNLLTNATNYTQPGGSIRVTTARPEAGWLTIQISDTGVGISPEEIERIFDRFYRGRASRVTGAEGTGLGLAISQEILQRMNGKITVDSIPGKGSTFTLWLRENVES